MNENALINVKNRSSKVTVEVDVVDADHNEGVLMAQGGRFGGWAIFVEDGHAGYVYNNLKNRTVLKSKSPLKKGNNTIVVDFKYDGGGIGKGGVTSLNVNGQSPVTAKLDSMIPSQFSIDEGADVACHRGSPVLGQQLGPH